MWHCQEWMLSYHPLAALLLYKLSKKYLEAALLAQIDKFEVVSEKYLRAEEGWRITESMSDNDAMIVEKLGKAYITVHCHSDDANFAWAYRLATVLSFRPFSRSGGLRNCFSRAVSRMPKETIYLSLSR